MKDILQQTNMNQVSGTHHALAMGEHQENEALMYTNKTTFVLLIKCIANMAPMVQSIWNISFIKQMFMKSNFSSNE